MKKISVIFIIGTVSIFLMISALISFIAIRNYKPSVAFYNIDSSAQQVILSMLDKEYKTVVLDESVPLSAQKNDFKNCSLIFAQTDYDVIDFCNSSSKVKTVPADFLSGMPSTVVEFVKTNSLNEKIHFVPLLFDFYQIDIDFAAYKEFSSQNSNRPLNYWDDFSDFLSFYAKFQKNPLVFYGKEPKNLLAITGILAEALPQNEDAPVLYEEFCSALYRAFKTDDSNFNNVRQIMEEACSEQGFLYPAITELSKIVKNQSLQKNTFQLEQKELYFYLENGVSFSAFLKLSDHRKIDHKSIGKFSSIYFPSRTDRVSRKFASPCICAIPLKNNAKIKKQIELLSNNRQTELSTRTGLSPVQKNCSVADHQADDVRYWIAASDGPVFPLYAAVPSNQAQNLCASLILEHILQ